MKWLRHHKIRLPSFEEKVTKKKMGAVFENFFWNGFNLASFFWCMKIYLRSDWCVRKSDPFRKHQNFVRSIAFLRQKDVVHVWIEHFLTFEIFIRLYSAALMQYRSPGGSWYCSCSMKYVVVGIYSRPLIRDRVLDDPLTLLAHWTFFGGGC